MTGKQKSKTPIEREENEDLGLTLLSAVCTIIVGYLSARIAADGASGA